MLFFMTVILLMSAGSSYAAGFTQPYSHYSDRENIRDVLADFARSQGYTAQLSEQISGLVSGRFDRVDPEVFAKGMEAAYGVRYYVLNDTTSITKARKHAPSSAPLRYSRRSCVPYCKTPASLPGNCP